MAREKTLKQTERVNVVMLKSVQEIAAGLMQARLKGDNFSELLRDLIIEEYKRPETATKAELEWLSISGGAGRDDQTQGRESKIAGQD